MKKNKIGLLIGLVCCSAMGAEHLSFNDNDTLSVQLSQNNINKIYLEGDAIVDLHVPDGFLANVNPDDIEDADGALYVQTVGNTPFTMYISTEQRHHVGLAVNPVKSTGKTLELIPKTASSKVIQWEKKNTYESSIISLMKALMLQKKPAGFGMETASTTQKLRVYESGRLTEKLVYNGAHLRGIVYELCNEGSQTLVLKEEDFMRDGVKAVALSQYMVAPNTRAIVYMVAGK